MARLEIFDDSDACSAEIHLSAMRDELDTMRDDPEYATDAGRLQMAIDDLEEKLARYWESGRDGGTDGTHNSIHVWI